MSVCVEGSQPNYWHKLSLVYIAPTQTPTSETTSDHLLPLVAGWGAVVSTLTHNKIHQSSLGEHVIGISKVIGDVVAPPQRAGASW